MRSKPTVAYVSSISSGLAILVPVAAPLVPARDEFLMML